MLEFTAIVLLCAELHNLDSCEPVAGWRRWSESEAACRAELQDYARDYFFQRHPDGTPVFPDQFVATRCTPVEEAHRS